MNIKLNLLILAAADEKSENITKQRNNRNTYAAILVNEFKEGKIDDQWISVSKSLFKGGEINLLTPISLLNLQKVLNSQQIY